MDVFNEIVSLISNVGFPIFACIMIFKELEKQRDTHKTESEKWVEALNNNTNVMKELLNRMES